MFRNSNNHSNAPVNASLVRKPYCKVCHDAGKPESEYTSHYVRALPDRTGKTNVTCPTLLNLSCRFCGKNGHTVKFCPEIANMKKAEERKKYAEERQAKEAEKKKYTTKQRTTGFAALQIDSDNEEEEDIVEPVQQPIQPLIGGYAAALMKPKPVSAPKPATGPDRIGEFKAITIKAGVKCEKDDDEDEEELKRMKAEYATKCKWMEDSDDEEEEEEENSAW